MLIKDIVKKDNPDLIIALSYLIDKSKSYILINQDEILDKKIEKQIIEIERQINKGYPLQYAIGKWDFYNLTLKVDERALIPRFETEIIVDHIINSSFKKNNILDIGAGSGAISLALASNLTNSQILGVDIEDKALELAIENKNLLEISNVDFIKSDLFSNVNGSFDIIISNPPYISPEDYNKLDSKLYFEPKSALVGRDDGLYFYKEIINKADSYLNEGGHLIFEIGYDQKDAINNLLTRSDFKNIVNMKDYNGYDRFIIAERG